MSDQDLTLQAARQALVNLAAELPLKQAEALLARMEGGCEYVTPAQQRSWRRSPQRQAIALELQWRREHEAGAGQ